ncbi:MAG: hypothetical protein JSR45_17935 [Proteobacteria bacterium]|nr:hypothetical protein [Pseudomonadota bacterium]
MARHPSRSHKPAIAPFTLGAAAMEKLAAVEGITFTPAMRRKIEAARDPRLTADQRRAILLAGLGGSRS